MGFANYIPALARVPKQQFGIALCTIDGEQAAAGDAHTPFSIQSVSKVLGLTPGLQALGASLWDRIGRGTVGQRVQLAGAARKRNAANRAIRSSMPAHCVWPTGF